MFCCCLSSSPPSSDYSNNNNEMVKYISPENHCALGVKISRKYSNRLFAHAELTTCHKPPQRFRTWISVWREVVKFNKLITEAELKNVKCSFVGCDGNGFLGAHVWYMGSIKRFSSWYITPACNKCNRNYNKGACLKSGSILIKVIKGNVFKPNEILVGSIQKEIKVKKRSSRKNKIEPSDENTTDDCYDENETSSTQSRIENGFITKTLKIPEKSKNWVFSDINNNNRLTSEHIIKNILYRIVP